MMWPMMDLARQAQDYWIDASQRSILFLDVLRRRGNTHFEHGARTAPNVLGFSFEFVADGRLLERPVNYGLVRIVPPAGVAVDDRKRPFIVFDPRAGHGPGIGGMKQDSEIGVALKAGHPCYFVGFLPDPLPGQTVEDVCRAEAVFVEVVARLHPDADGKPCLIGNCQAGWQIAMMAATHPDRVGPLLLAGAPLNYWAGVHGKNPLRYLGGLLGGTWQTALAGDLGAGIFDGAALVANFERMNPANTLWKKGYNVYSKIDTEEERFLDFETWWGSPVLLNAVEMQFIADELFLRNKLSSGEIVFSDGMRVDLRNIRTPIVVFCSWGDDITPPQQALGWILDLYDTDRELIAGGQTIVYALHQSIGHLGIFVSAKVANKEHDEFARTMDLIDVLPPGLYEAVFTEKTTDMPHPELVSGDHLVRFERRRLDDIRALGGNDAADDRRFATLARLSALNKGLYRATLGPVVNALATPQSAGALRAMDPYRLRFAAFSDRNPLMALVPPLAEAVRAHRRPVPVDNPLLGLQKAISEQIVLALDMARDVRDRATEGFFLTVYGSPQLQTLLGIDPNRPVPGHGRPGRDLTREAAILRAVADLSARMDQGGLAEAGLRALLYIDLGRTQVGADERGFAMLRHIRRRLFADRPFSLAYFKAMVREQYLLLLIDEERAVAAIATLLEDDPSGRAGMLDAIRLVVAASGELSQDAGRRLDRVESLFASVSGKTMPAARGMVGIAGS
ncbi:hypothetical protein AZL_b02380 (plasmid) [Azospirillum sp. B510]|uniref:DUF3141 domain-containing protein n=1 Tax=Azospirillum sp. (strain B510) TaxID=137722 RepID=UPI0001C4CC8F|nr:DUF3141 domain-containing protein [Azospirillum sp. B510]BAI74901.1 hypothetical protein AZL_b02380 [Azospirillum sp. B510]